MTMRPLETPGGGGEEQEEEEDHLEGSCCSRGPFGNDLSPAGVLAGIEH